MADRNTDYRREPEILEGHVVYGITGEPIKADPAHSWPACPVGPTNEGAWPLSVGVIEAGVQAFQRNYGAGRHGIRETVMAIWNDMHRTHRFELSAAAGPPALGVSPHAEHNAPAFLSVGDARRLFGDVAAIAAWASTVVAAEITNAGAMDQPIPGAVRELQLQLKAIADRNIKKASAGW